MTTETMQSASNVVRFPLERRATLDRLRAIAPDPREIDLLAATYDIAFPVDLEDQTDRETAEYIVNTVPVGGPERSATLREMLDDAVRTAIDAVENAGARANAAAAARQDVEAAGPGAGYRVLDVDSRAAELNRHGSGGAGGGACQVAGGVRCRAGGGIGASGRAVDPARL